VDQKEFKMELIFIYLISLLIYIIICGIGILFLEFKFNNKFRDKIQTKFSEFIGGILLE